MPKGKTSRPYTRKLKEEKDRAKRWQMEGDEAIKEEIRKFGAKHPLTKGSSDYMKNRERVKAGASNPATQKWRGKKK